VDDFFICALAEDFAGVVAMCFCVAAWVFGVRVSGRWASCAADKTVVTNSAIAPAMAALAIYPSIFIVHLS
jgi:hypothetical protein